MPENHSDGAHNPGAGKGERLPTAHVIELGEQRYMAMKDQLEREYAGHFVVFIIGSENYIIGETRVEAIEMHGREFPGTQGYLRPVGPADNDRTVSL